MAMARKKGKCSSAVPSYIRFIPDLIGTNTHCLLTEQPACRCPITIAAVGCTRVLGVRSTVRIIATTWTKVDDKLISASWQTSPTGLRQCWRVMLMSRLISETRLLRLARENMPVIKGNLDSRVARWFYRVIKKLTALVTSSYYYSSR